MHTKNIPTVLVIFGATGDLMKKKITPALYHLFERNELPSLFRVFGLSRADLSARSFQQRVAAILSHHTDIKPDEAKRASFVQLFTYQQGVFEDRSTYQELAHALQQVDRKWGVCSNKLFYLAVPPEHYETVFKNLAGSGLTKPCSPEEGWTRVLVEKPFGKDLATAKKLEALLGRLFKEIQIYRIDHYLAKEMLQNILTFRFSNNLFEGSWDYRSIEQIEIRLHETIGVEGRGSFYDGLGALRDVGQNHLLQMLALVTMEHPVSFEAETIRQKRAEILNNLLPPSQDEIRSHTIRAQYDGYRDISGVRPDSDTETFFAARAFLDSPLWCGVPIGFESGKRLESVRKDIVVTFHHPSPCLCPKGVSEHYKNTVTLSLEPQEGITIRFWSKKPGLEFEIEERTFDFLLRTGAHQTQYTEEYEKLLLDCITGDQTLFVSTDEVRAMWRFVDPLVKAWQQNIIPLKPYRPGSSEILASVESVLKSAPTKGPQLKKEIGIVGLGKMGGNLARRLLKKGWRVVGFNREADATKALEGEGIAGAYTLASLVRKLTPPRLVWLMVPAGVVDGVLFGRPGLEQFLGKGDIIIDGGNSFYNDSVSRSKKLKRKGIHFVDVGVSGGPQGALEGAALMVGGEKNLFEKLEPLFVDLAQEGGYQFFEGAGAGHFVKMVHNGIEYGMMQAIAEGFMILKNSSYKLDLSRVARVYNHGSVIESRLIGWLQKAFELYSEDLRKVSGRVEMSGEGEWTMKTAKELDLKAKVIEEAVKFRKQSVKHPSYTGKILSALRSQFGGHAIQ